MKQPNEDNSPLPGVLRAWKVATPLPPRFQSAVWRRIEQAEAARPATFWSVFAGWLQLALARRAVAIFYIAILLIMGLGTGYVQARQKSAHVENELGRRYVASVDPYQKAGR